MTAVKISTLPVVIFFKIYMYTYIVIFGCAGSLLLLGLFSRYEKRGLLSSCGVRASHCSGFSCCRAQALGHAGFHSCSPWAPEHRLNSCGTRVKLLCSMWTRVSCIGGGFFTTEPTGTAHLWVFFKTTTTTKMIWGKRMTVLSTAWEPVSRTGVCSKSGNHIAYIY